LKNAIRQIRVKTRCGIVPPKNGRPHSIGSGDESKNWRAGCFVNRFTNRERSKNLNSDNFHLL